MITPKAPKAKMKMKESNSCIPDSFKWGRDVRERQRTHTHTVLHMAFYSSMYTIDTPPHCTHTQDWKLRNGSVQGIFKCDIS